MKIEDFEKELRAIDKDLSIRVNNPPARVVEMFPDVLKLATITYVGVELCTIPSGDIYDEKNGSYGVDIRQDGRFVAHRTRPEALQIVKDKLSLLQIKDNADAFFGRGAYSDAALSRKDDPHVELVQEVSADAKSLEGSSELKLEDK